nr:MAG TPA: hypothetical protein [Caudoviricetes sp.]
MFWRECRTPSTINKMVTPKVRRSHSLKFV